MAERDSYRPGAFCWTVLLTPDAGGAKAFYRGLLGWEYEDHRAGATMLLLDGRQVGGMHQPEHEGIPPNWNSYVAVEDADAAAERATGLGASVVAGPFDRGDMLRMASIQDPQGAVFSVFQPKGHRGAALVNAPGALTLNQLNTTDPDAAGRFYTELFGWEVSQVSGPEDLPAYWGIYNGGRLNAGMMELAPGTGAPPHWLTYFGTEDIDAAAGRIGELGGRVMVEPTPVPGGRILVAQDPQGAFFALWAGNFDD